MPSPSSIELNAGPFFNGPCGLDVCHFSAAEDTMFFGLSHVTDGSLHGIVPATDGGRSANAWFFQDFFIVA
jgi:hypothetical protein